MGQLRTTSIDSRERHVQRAWVADPPRRDALDAVRLGEGGNLAGGSLSFLDVGHGADNS